MHRPNEPKTLTRKPLRTLTALGVATALAVVPLTGSAAVAQSTDATTGTHAETRPVDQPVPVGTWEVETTGDDGNVINTVLTFDADGTVSNPLGSGTWEERSSRSFSYDLSEEIYEDDDLVISIEISQNVFHRDGDTFRSRGSAVTYDADGNVIATNTVSSEGTRQ